MIAVVGRITAPGLAKTDVLGRTPHGAAPGVRPRPHGSYSTIPAPRPWSADSRIVPQ